MSKKITIGLILILLFILNLEGNKMIAQEVLKQPELVWKDIYGGIGFDKFNSITRTKDGGFVVAGHSDSKILNNTISNGDYDALIIKYNKKGEKEWTRIFGGSLFDSFQSVIETDDGGYLVCGYAQSNDKDLFGFYPKNDDSLIVKYDKNGTIQWKKVFGGSMMDRLTSVVKVNDGYVYTGFSDSNDGIFTDRNNGGFDAVILKTDLNGNIKWFKNFGGSKWDKFNSVVYNNGEIITVGYTDSIDGDLDGVIRKGNEDGLIVCFGEDGSIKWKKTFGGSDFERINDITASKDGYYIVGYSNSIDFDLKGIGANGLCDAIIAKIDFKGNKIWVKNFGGGENDYFTSVDYKEGFGVLTCGYSNSTDVDLVGLNKGDNDGIVVKFKEDGSKFWNQVIGQSGKETLEDVVYSDFFGFVCVGSSSSKDNEISVKGNDDAIIYKFEEPRIKVKGVRFKNNSVNIYIGGKKDLKLIFEPENATIKDVVWSIDNNKVAQIDNKGSILGLKYGQAVVTVKTIDGDYEAKCKVKVRYDFRKINDIYKFKNVVK